MSQTHSRVPLESKSTSTTPSTSHSSLGPSNSEQLQQLGSEQEDDILSYLPELFGDEDLDAPPSDAPEWAEDEDEDEDSILDSLDEDGILDSLDEDSLDEDSLDEDSLDEDGILDSLDEDSFREDSLDEDSLDEDSSEMEKELLIPKSDSEEESDESDDEPPLHNHPTEEDSHRKGGKTRRTDYVIKQKERVQEFQYPVQGGVKLGTDLARKKKKLPKGSKSAKVSDEERGANLTQGVVTGLSNGYGVFDSHRKRQTARHNKHVAQTEGGRKLAREEEKEHQVGVAKNALGFGLGTPGKLLKPVLKNVPGLNLPAKSVGVGQDTREGHWARRRATRLRDGGPTMKAVQQLEDERLLQSMSPRERGRARRQEKAGKKLRKRQVKSYKRARDQWHAGDMDDATFDKRWGKYHRARKLRHVAEYIRRHNRERAAKKSGKIITSLDAYVPPLAVITKPAKLLQLAGTKIKGFVRRVRRLRKIGKAKKELEPERKHGGGWKTKQLLGGNLSNQQSKVVEKLSNSASSEGEQDRIRKKYASKHKRYREDFVDMIRDDEDPVLQHVAREVATKSGMGPKRKHRDKGKAFQDREYWNARETRRDKHGNEDEVDILAERFDRETRI